MLEMLLGGKKVVSGGGIPADLGPGPTDLLGYYERGDGKNSGYFGTLTNFVSTAGLCQSIGLTVGHQQIENATWFKFLLDGKILYMPTNYIARNLHWNYIYNCGAVYGDDTFGLYQSPTPTAQSAKHTANGRTYRVRLVSISNVDPALTGVVDKTTEWGRLIYPVDSTVPATNTEAGEKWGSVDLGLGGTQIMGRETFSTTPGNSLIIVTNSTTRSSQSKSSAPSNNTWRPILELVQ